MKTVLFRRFENFMTAITFAEKGEHEYARRFVLPVAKRKYPNPSKRIEGNSPETRPQIRL